MSTSSTPASTSVVTWNIIGGDGDFTQPKTVSASVIGADATATTLYFPNLQGAAFGGDSRANVTMTVGPWAAGSSRPHSVTSGVVDFFQVTQYSQVLWTATGNGTQSTSLATGTLSVHCDVTVTTYQPSQSTVAARPCTTVSQNNYGGPQSYLVPTSTIAEPDLVDITMAPQIIAITAGVDKLVAATPASNTAPGLARMDIGVLGLIWLAMAVLLR
ncbi:hypothetical protein ANO11243_073470 [Dothideomycetidae sp. 11243]|nr:hypothetical protein ANO11243_073470 [fungal sp. No.11243]